MVRDGARMEGREAGGEAGQGGVRDPDLCHLESVSVGGRLMGRWLDSTEPQRPAVSCPTSGSDWRRGACRPAGAGRAAGAVGGVASRTQAVNS